MPTSPRYRAFGTYRLLLALVVVVSHSAWMLGGTGLGAALDGARIGTSAVLGFFVLSGFIMSEAAASFYCGRPAAFTRNRALKIFPPFAAALLLSVMAHGALLAAGLLHEGVAFEGYRSEPEGVLGLGNLVFNALSALPFLSIDRAKAVIGGDIYLFVRYVWAVKVEVAFYLAVLLFIARRRVLEPLIARHLEWALLGFAVLYGLNGLSAPFVYELQFAPYFLLGIGLYLAARDHPAGRLTLGLGSALSLLHALWFAGPDLQAITIKSLVAVVLLAAFVLCIPALARLRPGLGLARLDRRLGDLSYALYLNHYAVLVVFAALTPDHRRVAMWPVVVATAVAVSAAMQWAVERPLASVRDRLRGRPILADAGAAPAFRAPATAPASPAE